MLIGRDAAFWSDHSVGATGARRHRVRRYRIAGLPAARHDALATAMKKSVRFREVGLSARGIYKGYTFADVSTPLDNGRYRARVAIMALDGTRTRSQRFIDLEVFASLPEAGERVVAVARAWIDANAGNDQLALPTNFSPLD